MICNLVAAPFLVAPNAAEAAVATNLVDANGLLDLGAAVVVAVAVEVAVAVDPAAASAALSFVVVVSVSATTAGCLLTFKIRRLTKTSAEALAKASLRLAGSSPSSS